MVEEERREVWQSVLIPPGNDHDKETVKEEERKWGHPCCG